MNPVKGRYAILLYKDEYTMHLIPKSNGKLRTFKQKARAVKVAREIIKNELFYSEAKILQVTKELSNVSIIL